MVSFRKFFSILIMMAVILFMFQFTQVIKEQISDYDVNPYAAEEKLPDSGGPDQERSDRPPEGEDQSRGPIVYIGEESFRTASIVRQWCSYTKRDLAVWARVREDSWDTQRRPEYILVDSAAVAYGKETGRLKAYACRRSRWRRKESICSEIFCWAAPTSTGRNGRKTRNGRILRLRCPGM